MGAGGQRGVGLLEFLLALLVLSTGMMGLMSAQLAGKRASFDASQRSTATALARDILERMRANPGQLSAYHVSLAGAEGRRRPAPVADCDIAECSAEQLAAFDVWQWESYLLGGSEQFGAEDAGGLVSPLACISGEDGVVVVTITWLGVTPGVSAQAVPCGGEDIAPDASQLARAAAAQRHQLTIATLVAR